MKDKSLAVDDLVYEESISSKKTQVLFIALMILFLLLAIWRMAANSFDFLAGIMLFFSLFFLFYVLNFRTLVIRLTSEALHLKFGIFSWTVPLNNICSCQLDQLPRMMEMGGAGIHFMLIRKRYRASFNFLEYPRVVIAFKRKVGPVQDLSFSTRRPEEIIQLVQADLALDGVQN
jgi:hypothetical protein